MRPPRLLAVLSVSAVLLSGLTACTQTPIVTLPSVAQTAGNAPVRVGTSPVPDGGVPLEGALLAHVYTAALNAAGVNAVVVPENADSAQAVATVANGDVDIMAGYSTMYLDELQAVPPATPQDGTGTASASAPRSSGEVLSAVKKALPDGVRLAKAADAENNDTVVVTTVTAEKYQLKSLEDLGKVCAELTFGGSADFGAKDDGLPALASTYSCVPQTYRELPNDEAQLLMALLRAEVQVADIHSSSPAIEDNALVVLSDDKRIFRPYTVAPLVHNSTVSEDVAGVLDKVSAALNNEELVNLNRLSMDTHYASLDEVAVAWLVQQGLLKATS